MKFITSEKQIFIENDTELSQINNNYAYKSTQNIK